MSANILLLTLKVFSTTGGIEKVCRVAGKAAYEYSIENNMTVQVMSMHDKQSSADNNKYFPSEIFRGFNVFKVKFMASALWQGSRSRIVVISHINLVLAGWLIKKISPSVKVVLLAHGIEVWGKMNFFKRMMVSSCDEIISVSEFTLQTLLEVNRIAQAKCTVINNCLDPFLPLPQNVKKSEELRKRYGFARSDKILFTLSRLSARERYKGYDKVMEAIMQSGPEVKYLIAGSYDAKEKKFIELLIMNFGLQDRVVLAGYIAEEEVAAHFAISDCYVMPSIKEGFGIVFIEAMYYDIPVIAGNTDGSVDALRNGAFGLLVNPSRVNELREAINKILADPGKYIPDHKLLMQYFSYDSYKVKMNSMLNKHIHTEIEVKKNHPINQEIEVMQKENLSYHGGA